MHLADLLDLANALEKYAPHAHGRGYHVAAGWAEDLREVIGVEVTFLERAAAEAQDVAENGAVGPDVLPPEPTRTMDAKCPLPSLGHRRF